MITNERKIVLIVDDQETNRYILTKMFDKDFDVIESDNGSTAIEVVEKNINNIAIVLLDIIMPGMNGCDVLKYFNDRKLTSVFPVIMITGDRTQDLESKCLELGATDFILKPFTVDVVKKRVLNTVNFFEHKNKLEMLVSVQTQKLRTQSESMHHLYNQVIDVLSAVVEFRNVESGQHIKNVRKFTYIIAKCVMDNFPEYKLTDELCEKISEASALHDIGKIAVPDNILTKPDKLTVDEYDIMKGHTISGAQIIDNIGFIEDSKMHDLAYNICRYHHEKFDGNGYPDKLSDEEIPIEAQIVSLADVYDALISERVYKKCIPHNVSCEMILSGECGKFNPKLLKCFNDVKDEFEKII